VARRFRNSLVVYDAQDVREFALVALDTFCAVLEETPKRLAEPTLGNNSRDTNIHHTIVACIRRERNQFALTDVGQAPWSTHMPHRRKE
jgi:hypothetical protein